VGSKPSRAPKPDAWVLHASADWSTAHLEASREEVLDPLVDALFQAINRKKQRPTWQTAHRWRYALADTPLEEGCLATEDARILACGDWTNGNRVEGALLAGLAAASTVHDERRG
jgi:predicted NAD/FAD-dependent oxidoreductase